MLVVTNKRTGWREPSILWTIVNDPAGSKKSAAMKVFVDAIRSIYGSMDPPNSTLPLFDTTAASTNSVTMPYMINSIFTMPSLTSKIYQNGGHLLLMYDEMSLLFKNIGRDAKDSAMRQVFLSLNNGSGITQSTFTAGEQTMSYTNVNFCGYIQPDILFKQVQRGDSDGFLARMLVISPRLMSFKYDDYTTRDGSLDVQELLQTVKTNHELHHLEYKFSTEALPIYKEFFDTITKEIAEKDPFEEAVQRSVLNKMTAITNAVSRDVNTLIITEDTCMRGVAFAKLLLCHKMALITDPAADGPVCKPVQALSKEDLLDEKDKVVNVLTQPNITARALTHKRCLPGKTTNADNAKHFLTSLASNGFGEIVSGGRNSIALKRKSYSEMDINTQKMFDELEIDLELYEKLVSEDHPIKRKQMK